MSRRWINRAAVCAAIGLAVAVPYAWQAGAADSTTSAFRPITPCRLLDTRPTETVGVRNTPLGAGEAFTTTVWGTNGECTIPATATAVTMNVTIINPTADSYLTVFPDGPRPKASNLNWVAGQSPAANMVTSGLSSAGKFALFNLSGQVHVAIDIVGYFEPLAGASTGPKRTLLKDGNGRVLGEVLPWSTNSEWWVNDGTGIVSYGNDGWPAKPTATGTIRFEAFDCVGPPLVGDPLPSITAYVRPDASEPGGKIAFPVTGFRPSAATTTSSALFGTNCANGTGPVPQMWELIFGTEKIAQATTPFTLVLAP